MFKKRLALLLIVMTMTLMVVGCGGNPSSTTSSDSKDELIISVGSGITSGNYDPTQGYGTLGYGIFHTGLMKFDQTIESVPDLAIEYEVSEDSKVYTFRLRDDIKFSDGEPLTPEDVVFTYETAKESGLSVDLTKMVKAEVIGNDKVQFTLSEPYSPFLRSTALLGIVPKHAYDENYASNPIGTGPFKLKQLDIEQQLIVEPNENYYEKGSAFKQITFLAIDEETALTNAQSGQLDVVMINPEYASETVSGMKLESFKTSDNRGFNLPTVPESINADGVKVGNNVTSDIAVRKALNIGINRDEIIENALNGVGTPSWVRFEGLPWANLEPPFKDNQVAEAEKILEEAGWTDTDGDGIREKNGLKCEFSITGRTDDLQRYNLAAALAENARKLGINIIAEAKDWTTCKEIVRNVPTCFGTGDYSFVDVNNAFSSEFAGADESSTNNTAMYNNAIVDGYLKKAMEATNEKEAIENIKLAQYDGTNGINVDFPYIWLVNIDHTYFVKEGLSLGRQKIHPHGHGEPVIHNLVDWQYE